MKNLANEPFVTTLNYLDHVEFYNRAQIISPDNRDSVVDQLQNLFKLLNSAKNTRVLVLDSTSQRIRPDLLASICIGFWNRSTRPIIIMVGDMWQKDKWIQGWFQKIVLKLADRGIFRYAPMSTEEFSLFSSSWEIPQEKLRCLPYFYTFTDKDLVAPAPAQENFIFAGGNSHRDYIPLIQAIESLPDYEFVIASHLLDGMSLPSNVKAKQVPHKEFIRLMRASRAVIVPVRRKGIIRAAGPQTYLNSMLLRKPTIITDALGVREYTDNGRNAVIVDGSADGYVQAIRKVMDKANGTQIDAMCRSAYETTIKEFTFEKHCERLLEIIDEAVHDYFSK